jgi:hypothetical protein
MVSPGDVRFSLALVKANGNPLVMGREATAAEFFRGRLCAWTS